MDLIFIWNLEIISKLVCAILSRNSQLTSLKFELKLWSMWMYLRHTYVFLDQLIWAGNLCSLWPICIFYCIQVNLDMMDHCTTDFCTWRTICLVSVRCISSIRHLYTTDFAYDGPIFLVPLSPSHPSSPVFYCYGRYISFLKLFYLLISDLFPLPTYLLISSPFWPTYLTYLLIWS